MRSRTHVTLTASARPKGATTTHNYIYYCIEMKKKCGAERRKEKRVTIMKLSKRGATLRICPAQM